MERLRLEYQLSKPPVLREPHNYPLPNQRISGPGRRGTWLQGESGLSIQTVYGGTDIEKQAKELQSGSDIIVGTPGVLLICPNEDI